MLECFLDSWTKPSKSTILKLHPQCSVDECAKSLESGRTGLRPISLSEHQLARLFRAIGTIADRENLSPDEAISRMESVVAGKVTALSLAPIKRFADKLRTIAARQDSVLEISTASPTWTMLLELFIAQNENRLVAVMDLCIASGLSHSTALRHVERLEVMGLLTRQLDPSDARRYFITAKPRLLDRVGEVISEIQRAAVSGGIFLQEGTATSLREIIVE